MCKILNGKPKRKKPRGKPMRRCDDNIEVDPKRLAVKLRTEFVWLATSSNGEIL